MKPKYYFLRTACSRTLVNDILRTPFPLYFYVLLIYFTSSFVFLCNLKIVTQSPTLKLKNSIQEPAIQEPAHFDWQICIYTYK
jgi:hypothetical protein